MCIADTSTIPSLIPAAARQASTSSVMSMMSCRFFVFIVRYVVCVFMSGLEGGSGRGRAVISLGPAPHGDGVKRVGFRTRLFIILSLFTVIPAAVLTIIAG